MFLIVATVSILIFSALLRSSQTRAVAVGPALSGALPSALVARIARLRHFRDMVADRPTFLEFFAGGGMARAGLGSAWTCLFANDFDAKKAAAYRANWGDSEIRVADVRALDPADAPTADLAWASFPCQDLSLAGAGAGLSGERSGAFWPFLAMIDALGAQGRAPHVLALENVCGALSSHEGRDFSAICAALSQVGYRMGAFVVDAALFTPQSRPRLFIVAARRDIALPAESVSEHPVELWHGAAVRRAHARLPASLDPDWIWWNMPAPPRRNQVLADLIEDEPSDVAWKTPQETQALIAMMSDGHLAKLEAVRVGGRRIGALYKRTRTSADGVKTQRAEVRFDDVAGCLRTPAGGSSRQMIMVVDDKKLRARLISAREAARLMGLPDDYILPTRYNDAYHLVGDGVVVPVVRHIARHILEPLIGAARAMRPKERRSGSTSSALARVNVNE